MKDIIDVNGSLDIKALVDELQSKLTFIRQRDEQSYNMNNGLLYHNTDEYDFYRKIMWILTEYQKIRNRGYYE